MIGPGWLGWPVMALWLIGGGLEPIEPTPVIHGGVPAESCQWPSAVALFENSVLCSGTLIHPEVVLTAAHCIGDGPGPSAISFGETIFAPERSVPVDHCLANPAATGNLGPWDFAYCLLAEPVLDVPLTPPLMGCETDLLVMGQPVVIAGFGADDVDQSGIKQWATTIVSSATAGDVVLLGADGTAACSGDSGGSAFVQVGDGSWRAFGIVSGGVTCDADVTYVTIHSMIAWAEQQTGRDLTPCHDGDGTWNPGPGCSQFAGDPASPRGRWTEGCVGPTSGPSSTCGPAFASEGDLRPPSVAIVSPTDEQTFADTPAAFDIAIAATDDLSGVEHVELLIGLEVVAEDSEPPWGFADANFSGGSFELRARASDWQGNVADSEPVVIHVGESPSETEGESESESDSTSDDAASEDSPAACACTNERSTEPSAALWILVLVGAIRGSSGAGTRSDRRARRRR